MNKDEINPKWNFHFLSKNYWEVGDLEVDVENPSYIDPHLILMPNNSLSSNKEALCTYNCQIKHKLSYMVIDNGNQNNLPLLQLEKEQNLPTSTHPNSN